MEKSELYVIKDKDYRWHDISKGSTLGGSYLRCDFKMVTLRETKLTGKFYKCNFWWADLSGARLKNAIFHKCNFSSSSLVNAHLENSTFRGCTFDYADLNGVAGLSTAAFNRGCTFLGTKGVSKKGEQVIGFVPPEKILGPADRREKEERVNPPATLPEVDYYRSPPGKILKSELSHIPAADDVIDDWDDCGGYAMWMSGRNNQDSYWMKYKWGYENNAVLATSSIEELRDTTK